MSIRTTYTVLGLALVGVVAAIAWQFGLFSQKLSAKSAAVMLRRETQARRVTCGSGTDGWDYRCAIVYRDGSKGVLQVSVNGRTITGQTAP